MKKIIIISMLWSLPLLAQENPQRTVKENWVKYCVLCHGKDGKATALGLKRGAPEDVYRASDGKTVEQIFKVITEGGDGMRGFETKMTEEERKEMAQHIEYSTIINNVMNRRQRIEEELKRIKEDYEYLPECENVE